jgi:TonB family protein
MPFDLEFWKQWEGQLVDSVFPLERCIRGDERGAVYETNFEGRLGAIHVVPGKPAALELQQQRWKKVEGLSHPALVTMLARGDTTLGEQQYAYLVTERAEDNLADVLAERPLTAAETRETIVPVLGALRYLEKKGFGPGELKPSDVLAFGDQVKISSDHLVERVGPDAGVLRAVGTLVEQMLGSSGKDPAGLPAPFGEIVKNCKAADAASVASPGADGWNLARIESRLRGEERAAVAVPPKGSRRVLWAVAALAAAIALVAFFRRPQSVEPPPTKETATTPPVEGASTPPVAGVPVAPSPQQPKPETAKSSSVILPKPSPTGRNSKEVGRVVAPPTEKTSLVTTLDGVTQVLPDIPQSARRTITGRVRVNIRVHVDSNGRVTDASPMPPAVSQYFITRALAAARNWKFPPGGSPRDMVLRFELARDQSRVSVTQ